MKAAYKWRLQNGIYGYLTDETGSGEPFVYDVAQNARIYIDGTIVTGSTVNESSIANSVSRMTKQEYTNAFNNFKQLVDLEYPQVTLLDVIYYYNVESDECTASSSALKCSATDIIFHATAETLEAGEPATATVVNEQPDPSSGDTLIYRIDFEIPRGDKGETGPVPSVSATASATTVDSSLNASAVVVRTGPDLTPTFNFGFEIPRGKGIDGDGNLTASTVSATTIISETITANTISATTIISETFVKSGGTSVQYLMADGSVTTLTAGTNVTITKDDTTGVVTISAYDSDTNTWRPVKVNGNNFLGSGIDTKALNLSAGTNVTLNTNTDGTITISANDTDSNTWRKIQLNGNDILGTGTNTNPLNLSAGTNVTLTNNNGTVTISSSSSSTDEKVLQEKTTSTSPGQFRPMVLGYCSGATSAVTITSVTEQVFVDPKIVVKSDTHTLYTQRINNEYSITTGTLFVRSGITANTINIIGGNANTVPNLPTWVKLDYNTPPTLSDTNWAYVYFGSLGENVYFPLKTFNYIKVDTTTGQKESYFAFPTAMYPKNSVVILDYQTHVGGPAGYYHANFLTGINSSLEPSFYTVTLGLTVTVRRVAIIYLSDETFTTSVTGDIGEFTIPNDYVWYSET